MTLRWEHETTPLWDADKVRIIGGAPEGMFQALRGSPLGAPLGGTWGRVTSDGKVAGYGWMDVNWGDAEVLLAVAPDTKRTGIGTFVLDRLDEMAATAGLRYLVNVIPATHPDPESLASWLVRRGFSPAGEGGSLRRPVRARRAVPG